MIGIRSQFELFENFDLIAQVSGQNSFTSMSNNNFFEWSNMRNYGFSGSLGLSYRFKSSQSK